MSSHVLREIQRIHSAIHDAIVEQRLPPGTRLTELNLVQVFGANRNHIRAALRELAHMKLVRLEMNRGAFVEEPTPQQAREVFAARRVIEKALIEEACKRMQARDRKAIREHVAAELALGHDPERPEFVRLSGDFHRLLARIAGNSTLGDMLDGLIARSSLIIALYENRNGVQCSHDEHQSLAEAVLQGDSARAVRCMEQHLCNIEQRLHLEPPENHAVDLFQVFATRANA
ncbi:GntR family transcriptional regulator [Phytopseudomonas dryadis]|uniref:GntR family transcriptional regulator n=1 Tax=Phytopseudomonas dryadis TaxID=2487520 RepID=A0A4Q9QWX9_9GAMM|nr:MULTISPECIES: GntR family transcriptional regulator [Pseudomonas]TBU87083.1 GntR family transcriptional regulator [Pseudomonas dryadis]TBV09460.1 GntR family transcriptional regulator [Pseudomonas dryadis]TBV13373.1 GntR family transcriptional regulator [Pseudomonas sp. FRB 230]